MRYRDINSPLLIWADATCVAALIGINEYGRLLRSIGKGLNIKGYVTEIDDLRYGLELQLLNLEILRSRKKGFSKLPPQAHEGIDLLTGIGQTIPALSSNAQKRLRGQIVGGLKTSGLRPLQHEFRVAASLSNLVL